MRIDHEGQNLPISFQDIPLDPAVTRVLSEDGEKYKILIEGHVISEVSSFESGLYGLALDIGTTTVVVRLIDLVSGEALTARAFENPQRFAGTNIMARIQFDIENKGRLQQRTLLGYLTHAIESMPVDPLEIYEIVVAANPTMRDLFFGLNVETIGSKPYQSLTEIEMNDGIRESTSITTSAKKLRLPIHPKARIWSLPLLGCHVGADASACLLTTDIENDKLSFMLMDIGTNTEIICRTPGRLLVASCAAGPAFEGGSIDCGMPGLNGAIERVKISARQTPEFHVIGDVIPQGICGSGLIDLMSGLLRFGLMDQNGRLCSGQNKFYLINEPPIYLSESDISELAQAKAATHAGVQILLKQAGLKINNLDKLFLAGGFARHLDIEASKSINLIPEVPDNRIQQIGNAALEGASIALLSVPHRALLEELTNQVEHISLEKDPAFFDLFVDGCTF